ncbi:MAG: DNA protecting protein DprA [Polaromonas sp. 39-63-203]|uniref:DNA-processing protein DprA n=1 Tax=Polaromonas sp. TaxID=1869339 RepID=UPI000BC4F75E|nr:DNA-processing protein DprA [Polaromonas sp.]OZB01122.1 MAG: DNA protecting protein DprA [Polaromonas sp. 39-63-203]HQS31763.1 DNA-processing protein DprA [Polaromonas sp.]HQS89415.1 DNA-processing protein DprA [Polaromonas sp.]
MDTQELGAWLRLTLSPGVGNETARQLLASFGSPQAIFDQNAASLRQGGASDKLVRALLTEPPALAALLITTGEWLQAGSDRRVVALGDAAYPASLLNIEDPPLMLYMLGALAERAPAATEIIANSLAIVGSRNPTPQGESNARQFARAFAEAGVCVVSGLALGIDGAAHDGALLGGGQTIAVVGTGLDRVYPKKHLALAHRIAQQGMLISEFPLGTPPLVPNFPRRNRIIAGLSLGTLVVEAALKSGSLITARLAAEQGKEVFAIPGSIHSPQSRGCHALIKQGAKLVELAQDVLEEMRLPMGGSDHAPLLPDEPDLARRDDDPLIAALGFDAVSLDTLQARTGLDTARLQAQLLELELSGRVARLPGGLFQRQTVA